MQDCSVPCSTREREREPAPLGLSTWAQFSTRTVRGVLVQYSTELYSIIQYSAVLYSTAQCCAVVCSAVQYFTILYSTHYSIVQYSEVVHYSIVQHSTALCSTAALRSTVQYSTVHYSIVQHSTVVCSAVQYCAIRERERGRAREGRHLSLLTAFQIINHKGQG